MLDRALTPTEQRLARLVAEGRTEAELSAELHLGPHIVAWHLSRAYRKLGVGSRDELVAEVQLHRSSERLNHSTEEGNQ